MRGKVSVCHHKQDEKKTHKCPLDQVYGKGGLLKKKLKAAADRTLKEFGQLLAKIVSQFSWPGRYVYVFFHYFHTLRVYPLPQAVPVSRTRP